VPIAVQERLEQLLGLPGNTWDYDDVPVLFLTKDSHMFPEGVHAFLKQQGLWSRAEMRRITVPEDIVRGLRDSYTAFGDLDAWEVIRVWLKHRGEPFPPDVP
jgi:hypothetical protein